MLRDAVVPKSITRFIMRNGIVTLTGFASKLRQFRSMALEHFQLLSGLRLNLKTPLLR